MNMCYGFSCLTSQKKDRVGVTLLYRPDNMIDNTTKEHRLSIGNYRIIESSIYCQPITRLTNIQRTQNTFCLTNFDYEIALISWAPIHEHVLLTFSMNPLNSYTSTLFIVSYKTPFFLQRLSVLILWNFNHSCLSWSKDYYRLIFNLIKISF